MSVCDIPAPSQELVEKYESMKSVFYKRLLNAYTKLQAAVGDTERGQTAREIVESLQSKPELQAFVKVAR